MISIRYGLFKETILAFLLALRKYKHGLYEEIKAELFSDYLEQEFDLTEKDKADKKISEMTKDLYILIAAFENYHQVKHYESFKNLKKYLSSDAALPRKKHLSQKLRYAKNRQATE